MDVALALGLAVLRLRAETKSDWVEGVLAHLDLFLQDHAANEKKASAFALTLVVHYPDKRRLVETFLDIAREELEHFDTLVRLLHRRGLTLAPDAKDRYVIELMRHQRKNDAEAYLLDRLIVGAIIEARGTERFGILAACPALDDELRALYADLQKSEARHHATFLSVAKTYYDESRVQERLDALLDLEREIVNALPITGRLH